MRPSSEIAEETTDSPSELETAPASDTATRATSVVEAPEDEPTPRERFVGGVSDMNTVLKFLGTCIGIFCAVFGWFQLGGSTPTVDITSETEERRQLVTDDDSELGRDSASPSDQASTTTEVDAPTSTGALSAPTIPASPVTTAAPISAPPPTSAAPTTAAPTTAAPTTAAPTTAAPTTMAPPATTAAQAPSVPAPTNFRVDKQGIDASGRPFITLAWSKTSDIPIVQVERDGVIVRDDDNLAYRDVPDPALVSGQQVTYRIRALVDGQPSEWSDQITVTVA